jgi:hypothetical protein
VGAREPSEDYGIDVEVEVFKGGKATGLTFKVQSKGTNTPGSLTRQVKRKTINYWRRLDVPVLVVLWDKSLGLRYRWAHTIGMARPIDDGTKKISIRFDSSDVVDSAFVAGLPEFLEKYRSIKRGDIEPPLTISLNVEGDSGVNEGALRAEVQRFLAGQETQPPSDWRRLPRVQHICSSRRTASWRELPSILRQHQCRRVRRRREHLSSWQWISLS